MRRLLAISVLGVTLLIATVARDLVASVQGAVEPASPRLWIREAKP